MAQQYPYNEGEGQEAMKKLPDFFPRKKAIFNLLILVALLGLHLSPISTEGQGKSRFEYAGFGANKCVSGSLHVVTIDGDTIILDTGSFYSDDGVGAPEIPPDIAKKAKAIILSHAHIDHTGRIINMVKMGYKGKIYCTGPTKEILPVMLLMTARVSDYGKEDFYFSSNSFSRNKGEGRSTVCHLYKDCRNGKRISERNKQEITCTRLDLEKFGLHLCRDCAQRDVDMVMRQVYGAILHRKYRITPKLTAEFFNTPHLPGAMMTKITSNATGKSLLYTGDIGSGLSPYLPKQDQVDSSTWAIVEGTYGARVHSKKRETREEFQQYIGDHLRAKRRVIIPAFVLDRTQQVLGEISKGVKAGRIPKNTKVKVFSPSAAKLNEIYSRIFTTPRFANQFSKIFKDEGPFDHIFTEYVRAEDVDYGEVATCSSGMADNVYSKEFVKKWVSDPRTVFLFVGWQDPGSIGGRLTHLGKKLEEPTITIDGEEYPVKAEIRRFRCFSGHGKFDQIRDFLVKVNGLKSVLLVHSDPDTVKELAEAYKKYFPEIDFVIPEYNKRYSFVD